MPDTGEQCHSQPSRAIYSILLSLLLRQIDLEDGPRQTAPIRAYARQLIDDTETSPKNVLAYFDYVLSPIKITYQVIADRYAFASAESARTTLRRVRDRARSALPKPARTSLTTPAKPPRHRIEPHKTHFFVDACRNESGQIRYRVTSLPDIPASGNPGPDITTHYRAALAHLEYAVKQSEVMRDDYRKAGFGSVFRDEGESFDPYERGETITRGRNFRPSENYARQTGRAVRRGMANESAKIDDAIRQRLIEALGQSIGADVARRIIGIARNGVGDWSADYGYVLLQMSGEAIRAYHSGQSKGINHNASYLAKGAQFKFWKWYEKHTRENRFIATVATIFDRNIARRHRRGPAADDVFIRFERGWGIDSVIEYTEDVLRQKTAPGHWPLWGTRAKTEPPDT